jgi:hypothetical protein
LHCFFVMRLLTGRMSPSFSLACNKEGTRWLLITEQFYHIPTQKC